MSFASTSHLHSVRQTDELEAPLRAQLFSLWNQEFLREVAHPTPADLDEYLDRLLGARHHVLLDDGRLQGWLATFMRHTGTWFALLVAPQAQRQGLGRALLKRPMEAHDELHGWIALGDQNCRLDGTPYRSPEPFCRRLGFEVSDERFQVDTVSLAHIRWRRPGAL